MQGDIDTNAIGLLIIGIYPAIISEGYITSWIQFRIQSGVFGYREKVKCLNIYSHSVKMDPGKPIGFEGIAEGQVSASQEGSIFHGIGIKYP